jgi:adenosyl cobinamide kinase/adenosyl cobinamide phosphate guanylyltransferase
MDATPRAPGSAAAPSVTLVLGGARSGKSAVAERLALALAGAGPVHYLATAVVDPDDADFGARVAGHRERRGSRFHSVEAGGDLAGTLRRLPPEPALVDALGTWLASPTVTPAWAGDDAGDRLDELVGDLVATLAGRDAPTVVVSDETGLGIHPESAVGRRFRDALGTVNQRVAAGAGAVWLVVAGRVLPLAPAEDLIRARATAMAPPPPRPAAP